MKKLIVIAVVAAFTISFLPMAEAGDTANLGLTVTFAKNVPLELYADPEGPFEVEEGKPLEFKVIAQDPDALVVELKAVELPKGATFELDYNVITENYKRGTFKWTHKKTLQEKYDVDFHATSGDKYGNAEEKNLIVSITMRVTPIIAIELNNDRWGIEGIKLGGKVKNISPIDVFPSQPIHAVKNIGNVAVGVDIFYADYSGCKPGSEPGENIFATILYKDGYVYGQSIPLKGMVILTGRLEPEKAKGIPLEYQAPTAPSSGIKVMSAVYGLRAYPAVVKE